MFGRPSKRPIELALGGYGIIYIEWKKLET